MKLMRICLFSSLVATLATCTRETTASHLRPFAGAVTTNLERRRQLQAGDSNEDLPPPLESEDEDVPDMSVPEESRDEDLPDMSVPEESSDEDISCTCNGGQRPPAGVPPLDPVKTELTYPNIALEVASIGVSLIPGTGAEPHKLAMVAAALYEAFSVLNDELEPLTSVGMEAQGDVLEEASAEEEEEYLGYAGYGVLRRVLNGAPTQVALLDAKMEALGFDRNAVMGHPSAPIVMAVLMQHMPGPMPDYVASNIPSSTFDADCDTLSDLNYWQPQCIQASPGAQCTPQMIPFLPLYNARLISANGERNITHLISDVPEPPTYKAGDGNEEFWAEHQHTLDLSATLDDESKFIAEFHEPNAAVRFAALSVNEAEARQLSTQDSILLMFAVSGAIRDAIVGSVTMKIDYDTVRPITVIQCAFRGKTLKAWSKPYYGVQEFVNDDKEEGCDLWRPFLQTPPFQGYVSGHSAAAGAGATVFNLLFRDGVMKSNNCAVQKMGMSKTEPMILKGQLGHVCGVTEVPNEGPESIGFSPASDVTLCWETVASFSEQLSDSRLLGGIHIPADTTFGYDWGTKMGEVFYDFLSKKKATAIQLQ